MDNNDYVKSSLLSTSSLSNTINSGNILSMVITIKELDRRSKHMYTKVGEISGYVESTYQGGSIIMTCDLSKYNEELKLMNLVQENHIPYMVGWVKHFLVLGNPDDAVFADILYREGREDWQIRQALDAVTIHRSMYPEDSTTVLVRKFHQHFTAATHTDASYSHIRPRRTVEVRLRSLHSQASYPQLSTTLRNKSW